MKDEIEKIYQSITDGKISKDDGCKKITEIIFNHKRDFNLTRLTEDEFQDFLIFMLGKLDDVMKKYDKDQGCFFNFLYGSIKFAYSYWNLKNYRERQNSYFRNYMNYEILENETCVQEDLFNNEQEVIENQIDKNNKSTRELEDDNKNCFTILHSAIRFNRNSKPDEQYVNTILIIMLKSCFFLTDDLIERISEFTKIDIDTLNEYIKSAKKNIQKKEKRYNEYLARRDKLYYCSNKTMVKKIFLNDKNLNTSVTDLIYKKYKGKWKYYINKSNEFYKSITPSNRVISEILNIEERKVSYIIRKIRTAVMDNEKLKC